MLDLAERLLVEKGVLGLTMDALAAAAHCSKGTLYAWFGDRDGLVTELIERNGDRSAAALTATLTPPGDLESRLREVAAGLLTMLTGPVSVGLNRAAMTDPALAATLLAHGRHRIGPVVEAYLAEQQQSDRPRFPDPAAAFRTFYGLVVADTQIRVLLGERAPSTRAINATARAAVTDFLALYV